MGYLTETWDRIDQLLARAEAPTEQRDCMQTAYFLGARTMMNASVKAARIEQDAGLALLEECRSDCKAFQMEQCGRLLSWLEDTR